MAWALLSRAVMGAIHRGAWRTLSRIPWSWSAALLVTSLAPAGCGPSSGTGDDDDRGSGPSDRPGKVAQGDEELVFTMPYQDAPKPGSAEFATSTAIQRADVVFAMDNTGSMGGEVSNLKQSLRALIGAIRSEVRDTALGVVGFEDFPDYPFGISGDRPFRLLHRVMTTSSTRGLASLQAGVDKYEVQFTSGADTPESGWEMLYQLATGKGLPGGLVPPFDGATAAPTSAQAQAMDEEVGGLGGVGFRRGALPLVVWITDAPSHNSRVAGSGHPYPASYGAATSDIAMTAVQERGVKVLGVLSDDGEERARPDVHHAVTGTGAVVPPGAWGEAGQRPAGCGAGLCCTGVGGTGVPPEGDGCPLVFSVRGDGSGLSDTVVDAVKTLTGFLSLEISAVLVDDPGDEVDTAVFVERLVARPGAAAICTDLSTRDDDGDGHPDTFVKVSAGSTACFALEVRKNTSVAPQREQKEYPATVELRGDGVTVLASRKVRFVVPGSAGGIDDPSGGRGRTVE
jgi:hypothetical protein